MGYDHPRAGDGVDSHRFHRENLVAVSGHLATLTELGVQTSVLDDVTKKFGRSLSVSEESAMKALNIAPVKGLPLGSTNDYVAENSLFLANGIKDVDRVGVSYPDAGRVVVLREGWVLEDRLFFEHDIKGVGKTKSVTFDHIHKQFEPGSGVGVSMDVATDLEGTSGAAKLKILVPEILPPIVLDELVVNGERVRADDYHDGDKLLCIGRCWSSDVRVSNMYPGISSYLTVRDLRWIGQNRDIARKVFESRVNGYLNKVKKVNEYNSKNGTAYDIGCGSLLDGDYSYENYSRSFRYRMVDNASKMVGSDYYHLNCSPQNTSVAAEVGDWDRYGYVNSEGHWVTGDGIILTDPEVVKAYRANATYEVVMNTYKTQAVVDAVLGNDFIDINQYWELVRDNLPEEHWAKTISMEDIIRLVVKEGDVGKVWAEEQINASLRSIEVWNDELKSLSEIMADKSLDNA